MVWYGGCGGGDGGGDGGEWQAQPAWKIGAIEKTLSPGKQSQRSTSAKYKKAAVP
tara:strand:- start:1054 stop:1218 length:165 start_codon:yes stop_codon:yes gene_type:complete